MSGIVIFGFGPLLYAAIYYFRDTWEYLKEGETDDILIWQVSFPYMSVLSRLMIPSPQQASIFTASLNKFPMDLGVR
jgi:hypothetical protein